MGYYGNKKYWKFYSVDNLEGTGKLPWINVDIPPTFVPGVTYSHALKRHAACVLRAHLPLGLMTVLPCLFTWDLTFVVAALLSGLKLRHDRIFGTHDLERFDCPYRQREPHRGGAEVGPAAGPAPFLCSVSPDCGAGRPGARTCEDSGFQLDKLLHSPFPVELYSY